MSTKIIAELSSNHGGDLCRCLDMIVTAKQCGCWGAKFQFYGPQDLPDYDPLSNIVVPAAWLRHMFASAAQCNIVLFASIFAPWAVCPLVDCGCEFFKIASPESTRLADNIYRELFQFIHGNGKRFVSSGRQDFEYMRSVFPNSIMFYCKAGYPATVDADDIAFMKANAVGFSDHTDGIIAPLAMVGAGAQYIEKHFKLDDNCVDAAFSLNPDQMKTLCDLAS